MRIASFNINGLRSAASKGLFEWMESSNADVVALQETRCQLDQLPLQLRERDGWHAHFVCAEKKGYSGVGCYSRRPFDAVHTTLGQSSFDSEGRLMIAELGALLLANVYFPNGSGVLRDNSRVPYKLRFYRALRKRLAPELAAGRPVLVVGDFNTAPHEIDLARPKDNRNTSGFLEEERKELAAWIRAGFIDTFRHYEQAEGHYTWWSQRFGVRERNVGWRIDLALASPAAMKFVRASRIHPEVKGSDHCPISVDLDDRVLEARPDAHEALPPVPVRPAPRSQLPSSA